MTLGTCGAVRYYCGQPETAVSVDADGSLLHSDLLLQRQSGGLELPLALLAGGQLGLQRPHRVLNLTHLCSAVQYNTEQ